MGQLTLPKSGTVYVDTNAIVYRVERIEPSRPPCGTPSTKGPLS